MITPASMQPVRSASDTAEYRQNYVGNEIVKSLYALDNGWTGQGVTVGVLDDGVNSALPALQDQISSLSKDFGSETRNGVTTKRERLGDDQADHGTAIAAIIAGKRDGTGTMGMAPDAKIAILRTSDYNYDTKTEVLSHDAEALDYAATSGIKIVNRSLASQGFNVGIRNAAGRYGASGGLLVNSAGNQSASDPSDAVNVDAANRDAWLFVVAVDTSASSSYALASYSNKAGSMADRTVAAAGTNFTTRVDGSISAFSGTSSATAQVSGLAALIVSKWPQLSGVQAGEVILNTARDVGEPGVDAVFGHGLIDVEAALSPINPTISNGSAQSAVAQSIMVVPSAISTASLQTALSQVTVLDQYGRDFNGSMASMVVKPQARSTWLRRRLHQMTQGGSSSFAADKVQGSFSYATYRTGFAQSDVHSVMRSGEVAYQIGRTSVRAAFNAQDSLQSDIMGLAPFADGVLAYAPQAGNSFGVNRDTRFGRWGVTLSSGSVEGSAARAATVSFGVGRTSLRASWIEERGSVLGMESTGGLSLGRGTRTAMAEAHHSFDIGNDWSLEGYASVGVTRLKIDGASIVTGATSLIGTRAGIQASKVAFGGLLSFGIAQPLTIERGRAKLTLASAYDAGSQSLVFRSSNANLASDTRPLQLTAGFARGSASSSLRIGMMQDVSDGSTTALAGYSFRF
ncbi:MAG: S8 family peptidase [Sphingobium sp.]|uniref:S8 family peptidase n=1 Tax=Sphingobium sp. TaxID=1912891 RepID=UPI0029BC61D3|nr:S8 family peptidase [Sphingobium sp.]MDX3910769.1 S8 family peptidase [Sphingobium sp.]